MKITVLDAFGLNQGDLNFKEFEKFGEVVCYDITPQEEVVARSRGSEVLFTNKTKITAEMLRQLPEVKYIGILATGFNVVDVKEAGHLGITVTNIPAYSTMSVAQKVFELLLAIVGRAEHYAEENSRLRWARSPHFFYWDFPLHELAGKRFGIVGFGNTGKATARIADAFGMQVCLFTSKAQEELPDGYEKVETLDELFSTCDVVSLNCPLTADNALMVDARRLALMKPTAMLINTARGGLVDEEALALALDDETIYAAGLDVMTQEPPAEDNPLFTARNCFVTPHIAWATEEARRRLLTVAFDNLAAWADGHPVNVVS